MTGDASRSTTMSINALDPSWPLTRFAIIVVGLAILALIIDLWKTASNRRKAPDEFVASSDLPPLSHLIILSFLAYVGFFDLENYWTWWLFALALNVMFVGLLSVLQLKALIEQSDIGNSIKDETMMSFVLLGMLLSMNLLVYLAFVVIPASLAGVGIDEVFKTFKSMATGYWPYIFYGLAVCQFLFFKNNPKAFASVVVLLLAVIFIPLFLTAYWISLGVGLVVFFSLYTTRNHYVANSPGEGETSNIFILLLIVLPISCGLSLI